MIEGFNHKVEIIRTDERVNIYSTVSKDETTTQTLEASYKNIDEAEEKSKWLRRGWSGLNTLQLFMFMPPVFAATEAIMKFDTIKSPLILGAAFVAEIINLRLSEESGFEIDKLDHQLETIRELKDFNSSFKTKTFRIY